MNTASKGKPNSSALPIFALTVRLWFSFISWWLGPRAKWACSLRFFLVMSSSGFDRLAASVMSQKMADLVLASMAEPCSWRFLVLH